MGPGSVQKDKSAGAWGGIGIQDNFGSSVGQGGTHRGLGEFHFGLRCGVTYRGPSETRSM